MTPRGIEILVKKASVDDEFKDTLLAERSHSAYRIGLQLDPAEAEMLDTLPEAQLNKIIAETEVEPKLQPVFRGYSAIVMMAVVGAAASGCIPAATGSRPDEPLDKEDANNTNESELDEDDPELNVETGIRPDLPYLDEDGEEEETAAEDSEEERIPQVRTGVRADIPEEGE
ncbi:MAG: hypothetical protein GY771_00425 [bacterium]|nr:hypothetical protein [bacterium]